MFDIDFKSRRTIYEQLIKQIKMMIIQGVFEADEVLPPVNQLAREISINPNTIEKAYRKLESEGYIHTVPGEGRFIADVREMADAERQEVLIRELGVIAEELMSLGVSTDAIKKKIDQVQNDSREEEDR